MFIVSYKNMRWVCRTLISKESFILWKSTNPNDTVTLKRITFKGIAHVTVKLSEIKIE